MDRTKITYRTKPIQHSRKRVGPPRHDLYGRIVIDWLRKNGWDYGDRFTTELQYEEGQILFKKYTAPQKGFLPGESTEVPTGVHTVLSDGKGKNTASLQVYVKQGYWDQTWDPATKANRDTVFAQPDPSSPHRSMLVARLPLALRPKEFIA